MRDAQSDRIRAAARRQQARPQTSNHTGRIGVILSRVRVAALAVCLVVFSAAPLSTSQETTLPLRQPSDAAADGGCVLDSSLLGAPDLVATDRGIVRGAPAGDTDAFKGIPYAAPPVGDLRWKSPRPAPCWSGIRDATRFADVCAQPGARPATKTAWFGGEDCLYLNVWRPRNRAQDARLPVLLFVHGGSNLRGSGSETVSSTIPTLGPNIQDGEWLATRHNVVVVTINYRLGMLGFLAHSALSREAETGASGNYGLLDQIAALEWVQRNIAGFGGDPARVLAFGQSAGGRNVCTLLAIRGARRWFSRAGLLSGQCENLPSLNRAEAVGETWAARAGCADAPNAVPCLRRLSTEQAVAAFEQPGRLFANDYFQLGPIVDGVLVTDQPIVRLRSREGASAPLLVSSTNQEAAFSLFPLMFSGPIATADDFKAALETLAPVSIVAGIQRQYPVAAFATPKEALTAVLTDANLVCPARRIARTVAASGGTVWRAAWMHTASTGPARAFGPAHVTDLPFWFNSLSQMPQFVPTDSERALAESMSRYLATFATSGDPNVAGAITWPGYDAKTDQHIVLDNEITSARGFHSQSCDFWDANLLPAAYRSNP